MYIDGIGNETTRKMRLYSMYVFIPNKRERDLKGKTYIELDSASTNNMLYSNAFDDMYLMIWQIERINRYNYAMIEIFICAKLC